MRRRRRSTASRARPPSPPGRSWATAAALSLPGAAAAAEAERRRVVYGSGSQRLWARGYAAKEVVFGVGARASLLKRCSRRHLPSPVSSPSSIHASPTPTISRPLKTLS
uniref:Uncharacterized protein n=1 Tax=Oryza nivara TaxID=4536 RepID=A0A0E0H4L3_ORYNI